MKTIGKKVYIILLVVYAAICLTGCLRVTADELYSLPQMSEQYVRLKNQIDSVLGQGAEFSPPTGGSNRQSVQLKDLDGDGISEVLAFFSFPAESTLKIYVFTMTEGDYVVAEIIEGSGAGFESVRYEDMNGDGVTEVIVGWQISATLKYFSIYSIKDFRSALLAIGEYSELTVFDINGDDKKDVIALRLPSQETGAVAQMLALMEDGEIVSQEARLSGGIEAIARILTGKLADGVPAIFVESEGKYDGGSLLTDVCAFQDGSFTNILLTGMSGISEETVRARTIYSSDIDNSGVIKIPKPRLLKAQSETAYYAIDWYTFSSSGDSYLALTTYHNNSDEWYLILPFDWRGKVSVRREDVVSGERTVIFSYIEEDTEEYKDFMKIHKSYGDIGAARAKLPGRTLLATEGTSSYSFELLVPPNSFNLTFDEALIRENFRLIYSDWLAGTN